MKSSFYATIYAMKTQIFVPEQVEEAAQLIRNQEVVAFPTETVYGLGASIFSEEAIQKIFEAKGRPQDNPLIAHIGNLEQIELLAKELPKTFNALVKAFFPGPLTLVVHRLDSVPGIACGGLATIGIRQPGAPLARALINAAGVPLAAPSANLSGRPSATAARHVLDDLEGRIAGIIDGGQCQIGIESTVLDLVSFARPTILRPGGVTRAEIEKILGTEIDLYSKGPKGSPGMRYRHYAPRAPVKLFQSEVEFEGYMTAAPSARRMILSQAINGHIPLDRKTFYADLRRADEEQYDEVVIFADLKQLDPALVNRIEKATE
jgi:L-threonylcarbamoyladenylate synthase